MTWPSCITMGVRACTCKTPCDSYMDAARSNTDGQGHLPLPLHRKVRDIPCRSAGNESPERRGARWVDICNATLGHRSATPGMCTGRDKQARGQRVKTWRTPSFLCVFGEKVQRTHFRDVATELRIYSPIFSEPLFPGHFKCASVYLEMRN